MKKLFVRGKKGFTLIELLIVIAIIAILATIIILNVLSARKKANDSKVLSEMSAASKVAAICINEDGRLKYNVGPTDFFADNLAYNNVDEGKDICYDPALSPGVWPTFNNIQGTAPYKFELTRGAYIGTAKADFSLQVFDRSTAVAVIMVDCTGAGCKKMW